LGHYYLRATHENAILEESLLTPAQLLPNPAFQAPSFESVEPGPVSPIKKEEMDFLAGRTTICFENGLDPSSIIDVFILGKAYPGEEITPSIKMNSAPGISFQEFNAAPHFVKPDSVSLDPTKIALMPQLVRATAASNQIVIYWDIPQPTNYGGVKIFRSAERRLGDFAAVGEKVFDGSGSMEDFGLIVSQQPATNSDLPEPSRFLTEPPPEARTNPVIAPPLNNRAPLPPARLTALGIGLVFKETPHFVDTPPQRNAVFTYTLYAYDRMGHTAYPVVVNAALDSAANTRAFAEPPWGGPVIRLPTQNGRHP
jgi:hypothetical protein